MKVTIKEFSQKSGKTVNTISARIKKHGIKPAGTKTITARDYGGEFSIPVTTYPLKELERICSN